MAFRLERTLIPALQEMVKNLTTTAQEVRVQRPQCKMLAGHLMGLLPLLQELQKVPLTGSSVQALRTLMHELIGAQKVMQKMKDLSTLKLFFKNRSLSDGLSEATSRIQASLSSLPLVQLEASVKLLEEVNQVKLKLTELSTEMADQNSVCKDQQDFKHELSGVLRAQNMESTSGGGARVIEQLVTWLAKRFDSDVDTVRNEWEAVKEEILIPKEEIAFTNEMKRPWEEDLLLTLMSIDSQKQQEGPTYASNSFRGVTTEWAEDRSPEFTCTICLRLMTDPVIIASGYSYCRECIVNWFQGKDTCPNTNNRVAKDVLVDNIALRNLIRRWMETSQNGSEVSMQTELSRSALMEFINEESEQMEVRELPSASLTSSGSSSPQKAVATYITILKSNPPFQIILKSLKQLISLASYSKGKLQLFEAGGIPPIANLLKERHTAIAEKAAGVLEALTFEVKEGPGSTLSFEQRDRIANAVANLALGGLIDLMQFGSNAARLKAAQTVINIIGSEEIRAEHVHRLGMVTAFFGMMAIGEEFFFPNEGRSLCVKGLKLLSGEKPSGSADDAALTISLLRVAALEASPQVVKESLVALHGLVRTGGESICTLLRDNKAIPFLVRSISRCHGRVEALRILSEMSLLPGMPTAIVEHELFFHLLPVLSEMSEEEDCSVEATGLLSACLSSVKGDGSRLLTQEDLKGFVGLLGLGRTSSASKVDMLSALLYLCRESSPHRVTFLKSAGVATLLILAKSVSSAEIKESISHLIKVLASFPLCSKDILNQGGMLLIECLLVEGSLECRSQAVIAAESLITGPEGPMIPLDGFPFESVVDALCPSYAFESRGAAAGLMLVFAERSSQASMAFDNNVVNLLVDMVKQDDHVALGPKKKAATALLRILNEDGSLCPHVAMVDGLTFLIELWNRLELEDVEVSSSRESYQLRKDVQELGWRSFEEAFNPNQILCLYAIHPDSLVELSFFHVEGMTTLVGIGVPFSTIVVDPKQKNTISIEEGIESTWKELWMDGYIGSFFPLIFEKQEKIPETSSTCCTIGSSICLDLSAIEAVNKFGVGMEEGNHFITQSTTDADGFNKRSLEADWIYLLDKLVDHRRQHFQVRKEGHISGHGTSYGESATDTSQTRSEAESSLKKEDDASQPAGTSSKCTGKAYLQDTSQGTRSALQVKENLDNRNEEQKFLIIHVKMSERHCKLYNLDGTERICGIGPVINCSFIKPCMTIEFLCQQIANMEDEFVKKMNVTLNVDYQFSGDVEDPGKFGWYQNGFHISFGCEESDAAILDAQEVVSPLINVDVESTINKEESTILSNGSGCDVGAMGGFRPLCQVGVKRNTTRGLLHGSNQSDRKVESLQKRCLKDAPEFTVGNKSTGSKMEYRMALQSQHRPDFAPYKMWDRQARHDYESTGMFCTVGVCVKGTWQLGGEEHRYHQFGAEKELRQYVQIRNVSQAENSAVNNRWNQLWTSSSSMDPPSRSLSAMSRVPTYDEHIQEILRQKIEKRFLVNHSFSHIDLEARKRVLPYTWVLTAGVGKESPIRFLVE